MPHGAKKDNSCLITRIYFLIQKALVTVTNHLYFFKLHLYLFFFLSVYSI